MNSLGNNEIVNVLGYKINACLCNYILCLEHYNNLDSIPLFRSLFDDHKQYLVHIGTTNCEDNADSEYNSNLSDNNTSASNKFRVELDSHSNIPVVGLSAYIISDSSKAADVNAFNPDYKFKQIPIVDAALQYEDLYDGTTYTLVIKNVPYVLSMNNNLIPPFIMR